MLPYIPIMTSSNLRFQMSQQPVVAILKTLCVAIIVSVTFAAAGSIARADVQSTGVVDPVRNPFDPVNYPGLPVSGNFINPVEEPNPTNPNANNQTNFE